MDPLGIKLDVVSLCEYNLLLSGMHYLDVQRVMEHHSWLMKHCPELSTSTSRPSDSEVAARLYVAIQKKIKETFYRIKKEHAARPYIEIQNKLEELQIWDNMKYDYLQTNIDTEINKTKKHKCATANLEDGASATKKQKMDYSVREY